MKLFLRIRQEMQQRDAKHQARNKADRHLQAGMGQVNQQRQPATGQRSQQHQRTIEANAHADELMAPVII